MKIVLSILILCFSINSISSFSWFGFRSNQAVKQITSSSIIPPHSSFQTRRFTFQQQNHMHNVTNSVRQRIISSNTNSITNLSRHNIINQQQYHQRNTTAIHRQADSIIKKSSQIVPRNRFQAIVYQQQQQSRSSNNRSRLYQPSRILNNVTDQRVHPKFRSFFVGNKNNYTVINPGARRNFSQASLTKSVLADSKQNNSLNAKTNIPQFQFRSALARANLYRILTTKINNNKVSPDRRRLLENFYNQQRLKAFYQRLNEQTSARNHSNIKSALRRRKRQNEQKNYPLDISYQMINVRSDNDDAFDYN